MTGASRWSGWLKVLDWLAHGALGWLELLDWLAQGAGSASSKCSPDWLAQSAPLHRASRQLFCTHLLVLQVPNMLRLVVDRDRLNLGVVKTNDPVGDRRQGAVVGDDNDRGPLLAGHVLKNLQDLLASLVV